MYVKIIVISLMAIAVQHMAKLVYTFLSWGNDVHNHYPGPCKLVDGLTTRGSEDLTLLPNGVVLLSSGIDFAGKYKDHFGKIYSYNMNEDGPAKNVPIIGWPKGRSFEPHGLDHWITEEGVTQVFIVTHGPEAVARFVYDGSKLTFNKEYQNTTYLYNMNSVLATGDDSFYITNLLGTSYHSKWTMLEAVAMIPFGTIMYVQGDTYTPAAKNLMFSNGLTGNKRYVYVAVKDAIKIYSRVSDNQLILYKTIPSVIGSNDNIKLDAEGNLWVGCQMYLQQCIDYMKQQTPICASKVLRIRNPEGQHKTEAVFTDDGKFLSCVTVGIYHNDRLLIGTIMSDLAVCDVKYLMKD